MGAIDGRDRKGQGALEYLIIVAAVLAITAIVVVFLTGAFSGAKAKGGINSCRSTAASCYNTIQTSGGTCSFDDCAAPCRDSATGYDVVAKTIAVDATSCNSTGGNATACVACRIGNVSAIR